MQSINLRWLPKLELRIVMRPTHLELQVEVDPTQLYSSTKFGHFVKEQEGITKALSDNYT